jgi:hypothetical protein
MNINLITFQKRTDTIYGLKINNNDLLIQLPSCKMPFGVEEYKNSYIVNLDWYDPDRKMKKIVKSFNKILKRFSKFMKKEYKIYESMTDNGKNFKLRTKIRKYSNKLEIKVHHPEKTIFEINSKEYLNPIILLDSIWIMKDRIGINIYLKEVTVLNF